MGARLKCAKCEDVIESMHVHDFKPCKCGAIFIDGGNEYTRMGGEFEDILVEYRNKWIPMRERYDVGKPALED